jgi:hypothetical protein
MAMRDLKVFSMTGAKAINRKHAISLGRKLRAAQDMGETTLVDWTGVTEISGDFLKAVTHGLRADKVKFGGLWSRWQSSIASNIELPPPPGRT